MKKYVVAAVGFAIVFGLAVNASSFMRGTRIIKMTPLAEKKKKRVMVNFDIHKKAGIKCNTCHRKHNSGKRHFKRCGTCHNTSVKARKIGHLMCRNCHKTRKSQGLSHGPTKCAGCHKH